MDRAIYRAELTVCASQLRSMSGAAVGYATANRRHYPNRKAAADQPGSIVWGGNDDRPLLRPFLGGLKVLVDPMTGKINLDTTQSTYIRTTYMLWFGWRYTGNPGMRRIGDRFAWSYTASGGTTVTEKFDLLASDWDYIESPNRALTSHADRQGLMRIDRFDDVQPITDTNTWTAIRWLWTPEKRPPVDLNFARDDLSVSQFDELIWKDSDEPRTDPVPLYANGSNFATAQVFLPHE